MRKNITLRVTPTSTVGTKTFHIHGRRSTGTLIVRRDQDGFRVGLALCGPGESFRRKTGRQIAFTRLQSGAIGRMPKKGFYFFPGQDPGAWESQLSDMCTMLMAAKQPDLMLLEELSRLVSSFPEHFQYQKDQPAPQKALVASQ